MTTENPLYGKGHRLCGHGESCPNCSAYMDLAWTDAQALADVRTLDAWVLADMGRRIVTGGTTTRGLVRMLVHNGEVESFYGDGTDDARAKAAAWVRGLK